MPSAFTDSSSSASPGHSIGPLADFPQHRVMPVDVAGRRIGVLRRGDSVYAFSNRCPHQGGPMCHASVAGTMLPSEPDEYHFAMDGLIVKCPWHAYEFNVETGEGMGKIMRAKLPVYKTEIRNEEIFIIFGRG